MRSFKSNENIHKKEGGSYYVVSANKASSVTLQSPGNESQSLLWRGWDGCNIHVGMNFIFVDLAMCKFRRIAHKLS